MALRFPVYINELEGHSVGLTPALPGLTHTAKSKKDLIEFITSGPVVAMELEGDHAVSRFCLLYTSDAADE